MRALRQRGLVDFGGLILRAVEMLRADADVLAEVRARYPEVLVDEFQDTNRAAGELLLLVAGEAGQGLWVVGDLRQSIHRWRGASPANLTRLAERYPHLRVCTLRHCYRSVPAIVRVGAAMAARMDDLSAATAPSAGSRSPTAPLTAAITHPAATLAVRSAGSRPALARGEAYPTGAHERAALAAAIQRLHADGLAYRDQAVLCRTRKQVAVVAADLAAAGIPVAQPGGFFERPEVRGALGLLTLAAGPDARGLLLAPPLLAALGCPAVPPVELAVVARGLGAARRALPGALRQPDVLVAAGARSPALRAGLAALGEVAVEIRYAPSVADSLARFLLRPGGYAWRLARMAVGLESPGHAGANGANGGEGEDTRRPALNDGLAVPRTAADARTALAALGELVRLAARFDVRWTREPDFRARLSRAVRRHGGAEKPGPDQREVERREVERREVERRAAARPDAPADTREWPRSSDVMAAAPPDGAEDMAVGDALGGAPPSAPPSPPGEDTAPAVRCFLHYVDALRGAAAVIEVPAGDANAVQVLTLHRAKGLEFPVVFLPGLAMGQFPVARPSHEDPCPPGFREADAPGEREAEERCLFYVGATRARDLLVVTRALSYGRNPGGGARRAEASPLLALLEAAPEWRDAPPLTPEGVTTVPDGIDALAAAGDTDDDDGAGDGMDEEAAGPAALGLPTAAKRAYPFYALDQYLECPRQYRYAHDYALVDPADSAVSRFHRFVRGGMRDLRDLRAAEPEADWERAEARLRDRWHTDGPFGHAYDAFYWRAAQAILRGEWQALTADETSSLARATELAQKLRAELRRCVVEVTADRVIADGTGVILVRLHTGRPRKDDDKDLRLPLYYLAHRQEHPEVPVRVALAYVGDGLAGDGLAGEAPAPDSAAGHAPGGLADVTETARRAAEKYLKAERLQASALDKLDRAAVAIEAGAFEPRPRERVCASCAYRLVCPADPGAEL